MRQRVLHNSLAGQPLTPKRLDAFDINQLRRRPVEAMGSRAAVLQPGDSSLSLSLQPFAHCSRADAYSCADGLRRLPARNQFSVDGKPKMQLSGFMEFIV